MNLSHNRRTFSHVPDHLMQPDIRKSGLDLQTSNPADDNALHVGEEIAGYEVLAIARRDSVGIVYEVKSRNAASDVPVSQDRCAGDADGDSSRYYLRELFLQGYCSRPSVTGSVHALRNVVPCAGAREIFSKCRERFLAEGRSLVALGTKSGLVRVLRVFEANATAYQVTERPPVTTLADNIERMRRAETPRLSTRELSQILSTALEGLAHLHRVNVLHRNINPECIYLTEAGDAVIGDTFAAGQVLRDEIKLVNKLENNKLESAPHFLPREFKSDYPFVPIELQVSRGNQGCWSDLYALGASLHQALALTPPNPAHRRFKTVQNSEPDCYIPLRILLESVYPSRLLEALDWLLKVQVRDRPKSVVEIAGSLGLMPINNAKVQPRPGRWRRRRWSRRVASQSARVPHVPARQDHIMSKQSEKSSIKNLAVTAISAIVICGTVLFNMDMDMDMGDPTTSATASQSALYPSLQPAAAQTALLQEVEPTNLQNDSNAALIARSFQVEALLNKAELAWRDGRLLVPVKGSVLRHLERIIDTDPQNQDAVAAVNHLLHYFVDGLQEAETRGDAVAIRYLNRNIRRVRLRHPGSVPRVYDRFATLPVPPPSSTRMADVDMTRQRSELTPDFTPDFTQ